MVSIHGPPNMWKNWGTQFCLNCYPRDGTCAYIYFFPSTYLHTSSTQIMTIHFITCLNRKKKKFPCCTPLPSDEKTQLSSITFKAFLKGLLKAFLEENNMWATYIPPIPYVSTGGRYGDVPPPLRLKTLTPLSNPLPPPPLTTLPVPMYGLYCRSTCTYVLVQS